MTMANKVGPVEVSDTVLLAGGAVAVVLVIGALWYAKTKLSDAADAATDAAKATADYLRKDAVNVTSGKNVLNTAVNTVGQATGILGANDMTGQPNTIGSAIWEVGEWGRETFGDWW